MHHDENGHHHTNGHAYTNPHQRQPDLEAVDDMMFALARGGSRMFAAWLKQLYHDGREFAATDESERWQTLIGTNPLYKASSVLWSIANLDSIDLGADDPVDDPDSPTR